MIRVTAMAALLAMVGACTDAPQAASIDNNADSMDHNMAMKADKLDAMAAESSASMANDMMDNIDVNASITADNAAIASNDTMATQNAATAP